MEASSRFVSAVFFIALLSLWGCASELSSPGLILAPAESAGKTLDDIPALVDQLEQADFIVLGELHDNAEHHALQDAILRELHKRGWLKQIAMEMLQPNQQQAADLAVQGGVSDLNELNTFLDWHEGWDWELYGPIVSWAVAENVPLVAANLAPEELAMVREYAIRFSHELLPEEGQKLHRERFREAHCNTIDATTEERMLRVQISRDVRMANRLVSREGTVLITGNWHARKDIGVPNYMKVVRPDARVLVVGALEPSDAVLARPELYDVVWMTEALDRSDICAMFKTPPATTER